MNAWEFKSVVDYIAEYDSAVRSGCIQLGPGNHLTMWRGQLAVAEMTMPKATYTRRTFFISFDMLSEALEHTQPSDLIEVEWNGSLALKFTLYHPSGRFTVFDFPITGSSANVSPPPLPESETTNRLISSKTYRNLILKFAEGAACSHLAISIHPDGVRFRTEGESRFRMHTWHPTKPNDDVRIHDPVVIAMNKVAHTSTFYRIGSVVRIALHPGCVSFSTSTTRGIRLHVMVPTTHDGDT